jgi:hypothetical protein
VQFGKLFLTAEGQSCIAPEKLEIALAPLPHACIPTQSSLSISEDFQENPIFRVTFETTSFQTNNSYRWSTDQSR